MSLPFPGGESPDPLAALHAERERLGQELQRFVVADERRNAADAKLAEIDVALAAIDRADRQAIEAWAETAEGAAPEPLLAERKALLARRLDAEAERQAAEVAVEAVAARRASLIHAMNAVGARIRERQVAAALEQARAHHAEVEKLADEIGQRMMRVEALRQVFADSLSEAAARRDDAQAAIFRAALGDVEKLRAPQVLGDPASPRCAYLPIRRRHRPCGPALGASRRERRRTARPKRRNPPPMRRGGHVPRRSDRSLRITLPRPHP